MKKKIRNKILKNLSNNLTKAQKKKLKRALKDRTIIYSYSGKCPLGIIFGSSTSKIAQNSIKMEGINPSIFNETLIEEFWSFNHEKARKDIKRMLKKY